LKLQAEDGDQQSAASNSTQRLLMIQELYFVI